MFFTKSDDVVEQAAQRASGCSIPGGIQNQIGWGLGKLDLEDMEVGGPCLCRQLELDDPCGLFQAIL